MCVLERSGIEVAAADNSCVSGRSAGAVCSPSASRAASRASGAAERPAGGPGDDGARGRGRRDRVVRDLGDREPVQRADPFADRGPAGPGREALLHASRRGPALQALALLVREEPEGAIYFFADPNAPAVARLGTLIARLQSA